MRVAAIRVLPTSASSKSADLSGGAAAVNEQQLVGSYSTPCVFTTLVGSNMGSEGGISAVEARGLGSAQGTNLTKVREINTNCMHDVLLSRYNI